MAADDSDEPAEFACFEADALDILIKFEDSGLVKAFCEVFSMVEATL
jgi:hypothetical protein